MRFDASLPMGILDDLRCKRMRLAGGVVPANTERCRSSMVRGQSIGMPILRIGEAAIVHRVACHAMASWMRGLSQQRDGVTAPACRNAAYRAYCTAFDSLTDALLRVCLWVLQPKVTLGVLAACSHTCAWGPLQSHVVSLLKA